MPFYRLSGASTVYPCLDLFSRRNTTFKFYKELFPNDPEITLDDLHLVKKEGLEQHG